MVNLWWWNPAMLMLLRRFAHFARAWLERAICHLISILILKHLSALASGVAQQRPGTHAAGFSVVSTEKRVNSLVVKLILRGIPKRTEGTRAVRLQV